MEEGLLVVGANVVRFVPPLIISEDEMAQASELFGKVGIFESAKELVNATFMELQRNPEILN